ncbi:ParB N-terminal domain-containing protein [Martelella sp. HB161492]|uniref:ParB N-terminal domain-containing protein n=1 Tax=Martelella sp. HB161492 TaxID=2720726 RepID=UPI001FEE6D6A|nr:ParB N-terminal domain-containing protein [Martelella sp. HB161492]
MAATKTIPIAKIHVPERLRAVEDDQAAAISASIAEHGLLNPITVLATPAATPCFPQEAADPVFLLFVLVVLNSYHNVARTGLHQRSPGNGAPHNVIGDGQQRPAIRVSQHDRDG